MVYKNIYLKTNTGIRMGTASSLQNGCQMCKIGAKIQWQCKDCNLSICDRCKFTEHQKFGARHNIISEDKSSTIIKQAQVQIGCQLCKNGAWIRWKCEECNLSMCDRCKHIDHHTFGANHYIIQVKDSRVKLSAKSPNGGESKNEFSVLDQNSGFENNSLEIVSRIEDGHPNIKFRKLKEYAVGIFCIHYLDVSLNGSLWLGDNESGKILHIKLNNSDITVLSTINVKPYGLAVLPSGSPLIVLNSTSILKTITKTDGQITDSMYSIQNQCLIITVHVTKGQKIIVGCMEHNGNAFILVMDENI